MPEFTVRSDSVNVEQVMEQIRARIREKRGVDYTEDQIRELATVKLEKFLDPKGVRSDLLEQFRRAQPPYSPPELPNYAFEDATLFASHRAPLRWIRRLLRPLLKLFFNPNPLIQALNIQSRLNAMYAEREARREASRHGIEQLQYEVLHNLVVETTRMSIEVKNLKMRVESLASRLEFNERRARALESVVAYRPSSEAPREQKPPAPAPTPRPQVERPAEPAVPRPEGVAAAPAGEGPGQRSRRRRRRRGRRGSTPAASLMGGGTAEDQRPAGAADLSEMDSSAADSSDEEGPADSMADELLDRERGTPSGPGEPAAAAGGDDQTRQGRPSPDDPDPEPQ